MAPSQMGSRITSWGLMFEVNIPLQQETRRAQEREAEAMVVAARSRSEALSHHLLGELAVNRSAFDAALRTESPVRTQLLLPSAVTLPSLPLAS